MPREHATFSELYWPGMSNPDLETEKGWNGDVGGNLQPGESLVRGDTVRT